MNVERCACGWQLPLPDISLQIEGDPEACAELELSIGCPGCGQRYATTLAEDGWRLESGRFGQPFVRAGLPS